MTSLEAVGVLRAHLREPLNVGISTVKDPLRVALDKAILALYVVSRMEQESSDEQPQ